MKQRNHHTMDGQEKIITVSLPLGRKLDDFVSEICWQAWEQAGTQLNAAISLGMRPETFAKKLKLKRERLARSEASTELASGEGAKSSPERAGDSPEGQ